MPSIWHKIGDKLGKYLVVRRDGTVPHWPHFVLGARDPLAADTLRFYAGCLLEAGDKADMEYVRSIVELADDFEAYRAKEGDGDPPAAKHRTDDPNVLAAMSGKPRWLKAVPDVVNVPKD